jgi:hypothetical protein
VRALHVLANVDESGDVDGELGEHGEDDVGVEDVVLGALFGELLDGLGIIVISLWHWRGKG